MHARTGILTCGMYVTISRPPWDSDCVGICTAEWRQRYRPTLVPDEVRDYDQESLGGVVVLQLQQLDITPRRDP